MKVMTKEYKEDNMVQLSLNDDTSLWLVVDKDISIDVSTLFNLFNYSILNGGHFSAVDIF